MKRSRVVAKISLLELRPLSGMALLTALVVAQPVGELPPLELPLEAVEPVVELAEHWAAPAVALVEAQEELAQQEGRVVLAARSVRAVPVLAVAGPVGSIAVVGPLDTDTAVASDIAPGNLARLDMAPSFAVVAEASRVDVHRGHCVVP